MVADGDPAAYDPGQLAAGWRSMIMLASLVRRGGRPAAVAPTITLRPGEKQYGWFPVDVAGERRLAVITSRRLLLGEEYGLRTVTAVEPDPAHWSVTLCFGGGDQLTLRGPWVPWLTVVICAELYGSPWPPGFFSYSDMGAEASRRTWRYRGRLAMPRDGHGRSTSTGSS